MRCRHRAHQVCGLSHKTLSFSMALGSQKPAFARIKLNPRARFRAVPINTSIAHPPRVFVSATVALLGFNGWVSSAFSSSHNKLQVLLHLLPLQHPHPGFPSTVPSSCPLEQNPPHLKLQLFFHGTFPNIYWHTKGTT